MMIMMRRGRDVVNAKGCETGLVANGTSAGEGLFLVMDALFERFVVNGLSDGCKENAKTTAKAKAKAKE
jgi:hypothetical protein